MNRESGKYSIVLDHQPHDYAEQTAAGVDLVLTGHTHGGHGLCRPEERGWIRRPVSIGRFLIVRS